MEISAKVWPPLAILVSTSPFSHGTGTLWCLQNEMATYRHWPVSLWRDPDDVSHYWILSLDKTEWRLISVHSADEDAVSWLTSYGSWHAYEKKIRILKSSNMTVGQSSLISLAHHCYDCNLDLQTVDIKSWCRHNWKSAQVVNSHLVCDPTIRQPGFDLPRQQWSLLNRFRMEQGHCGAVSWLTSYGSWHTYEKKIRILHACLAQTERNRPRNTPN